MIKKTVLVWRKRGLKGQTMTEYALILAAVAIVAVVTYKVLGTTIVAGLDAIIACI